MIVYVRKLPVLLLVTFGVLVVTLQAHSSASLALTGLSFVKEGLAAREALIFVAQREGIAIENLVVGNEYMRGSPLLGRRFQDIKIINQLNGRIYSVLVDLDTGQVEDEAPIERQEQTLRQTKYGKLQPALYDRLQQLQSTDVVTITILVAAGPGLSADERSEAAYAELAAKYPEAQEAMASGRRPFDVADYTLAERLHSEYIDLFEADIPQLLKPLVDTLQAQGFSTLTWGAWPAVTTTVPKHFIQDLIARQDVGAILLEDEHQAAPSGKVSAPITTARVINSILYTNRAAVVHDRGIDGRGRDGTGVPIGIVDEPNVDFAAPNADPSICPAATFNCFERRWPNKFDPNLPDETRDQNNELNQHATLSASVAASSYYLYPGMAPGAKILSAGYKVGLPQSDVDALLWAAREGAVVINHSITSTRDEPRLTAWDYAYDYVADHYNVLITNSVGNSTAEYVHTPAKGWNTLAIGGYNHQNTNSWLDDTIVETTFTSYKNPQIERDWDGSLVPPDRQDHEKPEIVAPSENFNTLAACRRESHCGKIGSFLSLFQVPGGAPSSLFLPPRNLSGRKMARFRSLRQTARRKCPANKLQWHECCSASSSWLGGLAY